jgi:hypothetical protein
MANEFKTARAKHKFACGQDFTNLTVINFLGPGDAKFSAYCCNMNVDLDGDPQAYAPIGGHNLRPIDNLGNAGWKSAADNAAIKLRYEAAKQELAGLEEKRAALPASTTPASTASIPAAKHPTPNPAAVALDKQIKDKKQHLAAMSSEHIDANGRPSKHPPANFEKIFWKWYGVAALTPEEAAGENSYLEMSAPTFTPRKPVLDTTAAYEDVFGRFPVVQSVFEPGPGYFVTPLPHAANPRFPTWDQRYFLPPHETAQGAFGALALPLGAATGLKLNDTLFAVRLDTDDTLAFPFRDVGFGYKVAECSLDAFIGLGGDYRPANRGAAKFPNNFLNLYLAFPNRQKPADVLAKFATASNAAELPIVLSFVAQVTQTAKAKHAHAVGGDPLTAYEAWKKSKSDSKPDSYDVIVQGLRVAGSDFVERMTKLHGGLLGKDLLRPPTRP